MDPLAPEKDPGPDSRQRSFRQVVVVTLAVLLPSSVLMVLFTAFLLPRVFPGLFTTRCSKVKPDITAISSAVDQYAIENDGRYPESLEALVVPDEHGLSYLGQATVPRDAWGQEYGYEPPGKNDYRVFTYGSGGVPGGAGKARDIDNIMIRKGES